MYKIGSYNQNNIYLSDEERRQHFYLIGGTGVGKSGLFENLIRQDIAVGRGLCLLDPHFQLSYKIADSIPAERRRDVIYMNPMDTHVVGFNPLSVTDNPLYKDTIASHVLSAFEHAWPGFFSLPYWGPQSEYVLSNAIRLLLDTKGTTLADLSRLFSDRDFRYRLIDRCQNPDVKRVWEVDLADAKTLKQATDPLKDKVSPFATNAILRGVVGQPATIDIREIIDNRKILLCNLSTTMGEQVAKILGSLLVTSLYQAAQSRIDTPEESREDFTLYADEFQAFATLTFGTILSEARKYRLNLVLAHQFMAQLPEPLRKAVLGNVATLCAFRVGPDDEPTLRRHLNVHSLTETSNFEAWLRRTTHDSIKIETDAPEPSFKSFKAVLRHTRSRYARPRG